MNGQVARPTNAGIFLKSSSAVGADGMLLPLIAFSFQGSFILKDSTVPKLVNLNF